MDNVTQRVENRNSSFELLRKSPVIATFTNVWGYLSLHVLWLYI